MDSDESSSSLALLLESRGESRSYAKGTRLKDTGSFDFATWKDDARAFLLTKSDG